MTASNRLVNAWIFLNEDEPSVNGSPVGYNDPRSCYQTLIQNNVYQCVDILYLCFVTTVPADQGPFYTVEIGAASHPGGLSNQDYMNYIIRDARKNNPNIKIGVTLDWGSSSVLSNIFANTAYSDQQNAQGFAENLAQYIISNNLDGFDIDWEYPIDGAISPDQFILLTNAIRAAFNTAGNAAGRHLYFSLSPASVGNLDSDAVNNNMDFVNLQLYSGFTDAQEFLDAGISQSLLAYGAKFEAVSVSSQQGYQTAEQAYEGYVQGGYTVITQWRLNSSNFEFEQGQQKILYGLVHA